MRLICTCLHASSAIQGDRNPSENACDAPRTFEATCNDTCGWDTGGFVCKPLFCKPYKFFTDDPHVDVSLSTLSARADPNQDLEISCKVGYRAGSSLENASRSYNVTCSSDCSYTQGVKCTAVSCGILQLPRVKLRYWPNPYLPSTFDFQEEALRGDAEFNTSIFPYEPLSSLLHMHGESARVTCAPGTRTTDMSACGASATSFDVKCSDGQYLQVNSLLFCDTHPHNLSHT